MPSGKIHDSIAILTVVPVLLIGVYLFKFSPPQVYIFIFGSLFSQLMFGPDLDVQSRQYKRWGILKWIWLPYRKIIGHRSMFSHGMLFGPIFRCIYLFIIAVLIFIFGIYIFRHIAGNEVFLKLLPSLQYLFLNIEYNALLPFLIPFVSGIFIGAAIHTITDKIFSFFKNII